MTVLPGVIHAVFTCAAGLGLWHLWRVSARGNQRVAFIVGAGFVLRVAIGQGLFWISWLGLPLGESLQLGNGFWFFAADGDDYLAFAEAVLQAGPGAILHVDAVYSSHFFVQVVAVAIAMFGSAASIAILLNGAAYLGTCALIVRLAGPAPRTSAPCLIALVAVAFGPGTILWSTQLLKDSLLLFGTTAVVSACRYWQDYWLETGSNRSRWRLVGAVAAMSASLYGICGMRWYLAFIIWTASTFFFALVVLRARQRKPALIVSAAVFLVLSQSVRLGGDRDIPIELRRLLDPRPGSALAWKPSAVTTYLFAARSGFERTSAATVIVPGPLLTRGSTSTTGDPATAPVGAMTETVARAAALVLPRVVGQAAGVFRVGGGRGFWLFAELDTIAFDLVLMFALVYSIRRSASASGSVRPLSVFVVLIFVMLAPPMVYTVNNFGTLFRLRQILYLLGALVPLTLGALPVSGRP